MPSVRIDDLEMYFDDYGDPSNPTLVLLHGAGAHANDPIGGWADLIPAFAATHRVVAVEHRGHGRTANPAGYMTFEQIADDVEELVAQLGLRSYDLAGISDGGVAALAIALRRPDALRSVVVVGTNHCVDDSILAQLPMVDADVIEQAAPEAALAFADRHDGGKYPGFWRELLRQIRENNLHNPDWSPADLSTIACPILLIAGELDPFANIDQMTVMRRSIPHSEWLIVNHAGHAVHHEHPDLVGPRIIDFLDRVRLGADPST